MNDANQVIGSVWGLLERQAQKLPVQIPEFLGAGLYKIDVAPLWIDLKKIVDGTRGAFFPCNQHLPLLVWHQGDYVFIPIVDHAHLN